MAWGAFKNMNELVNDKMNELLEVLGCPVRGGDTRGAIEKALQVVKCQGVGNTGSNNYGDWNTGNYNPGDWNTGDWNTGDWNTGKYNPGDRNTGGWNTGDCNTGSWNTGDSNTGYYNTGSQNTGSWNAGDYHSGFFNTKKPKIMFFNKETDVDVSSVDFPEWLYFDLPETYYPADYENGTEPDLYKLAAQQSYNEASKEDQDAIEDMPNYDADVLFELFGIDRRK